MKYFIQRLITFVTAAVLVLVLAQNLLSSGLDLVGSGPVLLVSLVFSIIYAITFGVSKLIEKLARNWISLGSNLKRDTLIAVCFILGCVGFLFAPRPAGFSFGDSIGEIFKEGRLTPYGWQVQSEAFVQCLVVSAIFWIFSRAKFLNRPDA